MALHPVYVDFKTRGTADVSKAIRSISDAIVQAESRSTASVAASVSERQKIVAREASEKIRQSQRSSAMATAASRSGATEIARSARAEAREAQRAASTKIRELNRVQAEERRIRAESLRSVIKAGGLKTLSADNPHVVDALVPRRSSGPESADLEAARKIRAQQKIDAMHASAQSKAERLAASEQKTQERAAAEHTRIEERKARDGIRAIEKQFRAEKREQENSVKEEERSAQRRNSIRERSALMAGRFAARQAAAEARERKRAEAETGRQREKLGRTLGGAGRGALQTATTVAGSMARGMLDLGGGFSVADSAKREVALRGQAAQLAASSEGNFTSTGLVSSAREVATKQALDPEDVLRGYDEIKKLTGDLGKATQLMPELAKLATATGADVGELSGLAGNILASNPNISNDDMQKQLRLFTQQGVVGGVEVADFAKYGSRITAGAGLFGGNREENQAVLGGMAQIARQRGGAATAAEATLGAQRFGTDIQKHAKSLAAQGIKVSDGQGTLRNAEDVAIDMLNKTGGDVTKLAGLGLGERGIKPLTGVADIYREAGGGKKGEAAVRKEFAKYKAVMTAAEVEAKNKKRLAEVDAQLTMVMGELRAAVGQELLPVIIKSLPEFKKLVPMIADVVRAGAQFASFFAAQPLAGLAVLIGASFSKELATAGISKVLETALATKLGGSAGLVLGSAAIAITAATLAVEKMAEDDTKTQTKSLNADINAANVLPLLRPGGIKTKEDEEQVRSAKEGLEKSIADREANKGGSDWFYGAAKLGGYVADAATLGKAGSSAAVDEAHAARVASDQGVIDRQREELAKLTAALEKHATELAKNTAATAANTGATAGGGPKPPAVPSGPGPIKDSGR